MANHLESVSKKTTAHAFWVKKIILTNFRNYSQMKLETEQLPVIITGANGIGKTNILESISLLSPGRGLRRIKLNEADRIADGLVKPWSVASVIGCGYEETNIGTGREATSDSRRIIKIDGNVVKGQAELAASFSVMWLTPQMDGLFIGSSSDRRKFLDRLVYNFDAEHASRIYSYEYTVRERAKLLQNNGDSGWISALENKIAEKAVSIAIARADTIANISQAIMASQTAFPKAIIGVDGDVERMCESYTALGAEENLRRQLFDNRRYDAASGRTSTGTHRSDFIVTHMEKSMPAAFCSTGEQKALLLSIILAEARAKAAWKNNVPVLLLDEVVAHLDDERRSSLFHELLDMKAQVWMTGTDTILFEDLRNKAQFISVSDGQLTNNVI